MELEYQFITKEIPDKKVAYLVLRRASPEKVWELLGRAEAKAAEQGAERLLAASMDPLAPLNEGSSHGLRLEFAHDMHLLERRLKDAPLPGGELTLTPLCEERFAEWLERFNRGFFAVPNSAAYERADLEAGLAEGKLYGFAQTAGAAVGVYELDPCAQPPEIESIALDAAARGKGLGRELLRAVMAELARQGAQECRLTVSTANPVAYGLYSAEGFQFAGLKSRWFRVIRETAS